MLIQVWEWLLLMSCCCPGCVVRPDSGLISLQASFLCLLHQTNLYLILQAKGTVVVLCSSHAGISPHCWSVNDLRGGRERQICLYFFHLSADSFGKGKLHWKYFICLHTAEWFWKHRLKILSMCHSKRYIWLLLLKSWPWFCTWWL